MRVASHMKPEIRGRTWSGVSMCMGMVERFVGRA